MVQVSIQKRDRDYYLRRLEKDHPKHFEDLKVGRYTSVRDAAIAAGLVSPPKPVNVLTRAWGRATPAERQLFLQSIGCAPLSSVTTASAPVIHVARKLQPWARTRIREIIIRRGLKMGDVMVELGMDKLDASLGLALSRETRLQPNLLLRLENWLSANAAI